MSTLQVGKVIQVSNSKFHAASVLIYSVLGLGYFALSVRLAQQEGFSGFWTSIFLPLLQLAIPSAAAWIYYSRIFQCGLLGGRSVLLSWGISLIGLCLTVIVPLSFIVAIQSRAINIGVSYLLLVLYILFFGGVVGKWFDRVNR